jgi:tRNA(fMet)-specific endonuclease VapC
MGATNPSDDSRPYRSCLVLGRMANLPGCATGVRHQEKCANPANERAKVNLLLVTVHQLMFDVRAAMEAGRLRALLEAQGQMIGPYDILLAGHALTAGLIFVTGNTGEFSRVPGLILEN